MSVTSWNVPDNVSNFSFEHIFSRYTSLQFDKFKYAINPRIKLSIVRCDSLQGATRRYKTWIPFLKQHKQVFIVDN